MADSANPRLVLTSFFVSGTMLSKTANTAKMGQMPSDQLQRVNVRHAAIGSILFGMWQCIHTIAIATRSAQKKPQKKTAHSNRCESHSKISTTKSRTTRCPRMCVCICCFSPPRAIHRTFGTTTDYRGVVLRRFATSADGTATTAAAAVERVLMIYAFNWCRRWRRNAEQVDRPPYFLSCEVCGCFCVCAALRPEIELETMSAPGDAIIVCCCHIMLGWVENSLLDYFSEFLSTIIQLQVQILCSIQNDFCFTMVLVLSFQ